MNAPDIDRVIHIPVGGQTPLPGRFENADIVSAKPYDLVARLVDGEGSLR